MSLSDKTKKAIGREDLPKREDLSNALGVQVTPIMKKDTSELRGWEKAEAELLQTNNALSVEDNDPFFTLYEITQRNALIKPTYDPWQLSVLTHQNNTLLQCISAMEINIDGTGYVIEPRDPKDHEETVRGEIDGERQEAFPPEDPPQYEQTDPEKRTPTQKKRVVERKDKLREKEIEEKFKEPPKDEAGIREQEKEKFLEREREKAEQEEIKERAQALQDEEDEIKKGIEDFFDEPWPGMSFTTIRRKLRRDLETTGNAYMEVIRDVKGDITFLNYLDAKLVRLVRLGKPIVVEEEIERFGKTRKVQRLKRERRYAMLIGAKTTPSNVTKVMYFKEFGASRELNKWTGLWEGSNEDLPPSQSGQRATSPSGGDAKAGDSRFEGTNPFGPSADGVQPVPVPGLTGVESNEMKDLGGAVEPKDRATEIIHFTALPDVSTLYGVPRWINQIPSILGSRKAEEQNLEFFNSGGIPPAMILIQGGSLSEQSRNALTSYMAGESKYKQRGIIAELFSTSGDLTSAGQVRVAVERFGAERQQDAMFMKYDEACYKHVRMAFRLPPLFLGDSAEHTFATAQTSVAMTEDQVFVPERGEFDEVVNNLIMKEVAPEWVYRSMPLALKDVEKQLKALELSKDMVDQECWVGQMAEVANLELECGEEPEEEPDMFMEIANKTGILNGLSAAEKNGEMGQPFQSAKVEGDENGKIAKIDDWFIKDLADDWSAWVSGDKEYQDESINAMRQMIKSLAPSVRSLFDGYVAMRLMPEGSHDSDGTADLLSHAAMHEADAMFKDDWNVGDLEESGGKLNPEQGEKLKRKKPKS